MAIRFKYSFLLVLGCTFIISCGQSGGLAPELVGAGCAPSANRIIFLTASTYTGAQVAGVAGADAKCNSDANRPACAGTFKAMIVDEVPNRRACTGCSGAGGEGIDWVMLPNTTYSRVDGTVILTTDGDGVVQGSITNSIAGLNVRAWTGVENSWPTRTGGTCSNWTSTTGTVRAGKADEIGLPQWFSHPTPQINCSDAAHLYCVEQ